MFVLKPETAKQVKALTKRSIPSFGQTQAEDATEHIPFIYVVRTPEDGIPAAEDTEPDDPGGQPVRTVGEAECMLCKLNLETMELVPTSDPEVLRNVVNLQLAELSGHEYFAVVQEAFTGQLVAMVGAVCAAQNCIQQIHILGGPTGGTLQATIAGEVVEFDFDADEAAVQAVLDAALGEGNTVATLGGPALPNVSLTIEFTGDLAEHPIAIIELDWDGLTGGTGVGAIPSMVQPGRS